MLYAYSERNFKDMGHGKEFLFCRETKVSWLCRRAITEECVKGDDVYTVHLAKRAEEQLDEIEHKLTDNKKRENITQQEKKEERKKERKRIIEPI
jgi:hypothetical protein